MVGRERSAVGGSTALSPSRDRTDLSLAMPREGFRVRAPRVNPRCPLEPDVGSSAPRDHRRRDGPDDPVTTGRAEG